MFDKDGYIKCPNCLGSGWDAEALHNEIANQTYEKLIGEYGHYSYDNEEHLAELANLQKKMWNDVKKDIIEKDPIACRCSKCEGTGKIDWVTAIMNNDKKI